MKVYYTDIIEKAGQPIWWDEHGVPRYVPFAPWNVGPYNEAVALMEIKCQHCAKPFIVAEIIDMLSGRAWPHMSHAIIERVKKLVERGGTIDADELKIALEPQMSDVPQIQAPKAFSDDAGMFHYGDPPAHDCVGDTMNSEPVRILEFWQVNPDLNGGGLYMLRKHENEVIIEHPSEPYEGLQ